MSDRKISFEKIQNARDLGGLVNTEGQVISKGLLIRSAGLFEASPADIHRLRTAYRLKKIIDLRTETERQEKPDAAVWGAEYCHMPVFDKSVAGISHEKANDILKAIPALDELYRMMVTDADCLRNLGRAAAAVMEQDFSGGSVLWHCTEGKDRCGLLSAVLLMALKVDRKQITEDYLLTNDVNRPKARGFYQKMLSIGKTKQEAEVVRDLFLAKESYLRSAFDGIDEHYQDSETFLMEALSIPEKTITLFRKRVLI